MEILISQKLGLAAIFQRGKKPRVLYSGPTQALGGIEVVEFSDYATKGERADALEMVTSSFARSIAINL